MCPIALGSREQRSRSHCIDSWKNAHYCFPFTANIVEKNLFFFSCLFISFRFFIFFLCFFFLCFVSFLTVLFPFSAFPRFFPRYFSHCFLFVIFFVCFFFFGFFFFWLLLLLFFFFFSFCFLHFSVYRYPVLGVFSQISISMISSHLCLKCYCTSNIETMVEENLSINLKSNFFTVYGSKWEICFATRQNASLMQLSCCDFYYNLVKIVHVMSFDMPLHLRAKTGFLYWIINNQRGHVYNSILTLKHKFIRVICQNLILGKILFRMFLTN